MRAVRYHGREDVRVDDVPEPVCGSGQVKVCQTNSTSRHCRGGFQASHHPKIKPAFVGICGSGQSPSMKSIQLLDFRLDR